MTSYFLRVLALGATATVGLTLASFAVAMLLGFWLALMRLSRWRVLTAIARAYLEALRNIPILTQLFILYFGLARLGLNLPAVVAGILGFGLNGAALMSEVFRSSIIAVDRGQREAALALGMTPPRALRYILLPQAIRIALPPIGNFAIGLLKDTSLASTVAIPELVFRAQMLINQTYRTSEIYYLVALFYLAISFPLSLLVAHSERHLAPPR